MGNSIQQRKTCKDNDVKQKQLTSLRWQVGINNNFRELFSPSFAQNIGSLSLNNSKIGPKGIKLLTSIEWPFLSNLMLNENRIKDKGMAYLAKLKLPSLIRLNIVDNLLRDTSCKSILKANWPLVKTITFNYDGKEKQRRMNKITTFGVRKLKQIKNGQVNCQINETFPRNIFFVEYQDEVFIQDLQGEQ